MPTLRTRRSSSKGKSSRKSSGKSSGSLDESLASVANEDAITMDPSMVGGDEEDGEEDQGGYDEDFNGPTEEYYEDDGGWGHGGGGDEDFLGGFEESMWQGETEQQRQNRVVILLEELQNLEDQGYSLPKRFNHTSDPDEMEMVVEAGKRQVSRKIGTELSKNVLIGLVSGLEMMNHTYDPLGLKLDGFGDNVRTNIATYEDVLGRIWMQYGPGADGEINPIVQLTVMLAMAGASVHWSNGKMEEFRAMQEKMREKQEKAAQRAQQGTQRSHQEAFAATSPVAPGGANPGGFDAMSSFMPPNLSQMMAEGSSELPSMEPFPEFDPVGDSGPSLSSTRKRSNASLDETLDDVLNEVTSTASNTTEPKGRTISVGHSSSSSRKGRKKKSHRIALKRS